MTPIFLYLAAASTVVTAFAHSYFGEKLLISKILLMHTGILAFERARVLIRFAWHLTSLMWLVQAIALIDNAIIIHDFKYIAGTGAVHLIAGLYDCYATKGKHMGWPMLTATGLFCLLALI